MSEKKNPPNTADPKQATPPPKPTPPSADHKNPSASPAPATPSASNKNPADKTAATKPADIKASASPAPVTPSTGSKNPADKAAATQATPASSAEKRTPPPPSTQNTNSNSGKGLTLITLLVAAAALALSGYQFTQIAALKSALNDQRTATTKDLSRLDSVDQHTSEQLSALQRDLAQVQVPAPGVDMAAVNQAIAENNAQSKAALEQALANLPKGLARSDVQSLVKQELATFAQTLDGNRPALDFSDEIAKVQASESSAKQVLAQIEQRASEWDQHVKQTLADAEKHLNDVAGSQSSLVHLLALAQLAGHAGQYQAAAQYLQQASALLPGSEHMDWQGAIRDAAEQYQRYAAQPSPTTTLDLLIQGVEQWPLRESGHSNMLQSDANAQSDTFMGKMQQIGHDILANTVTVMPLDDEGLVWIEQNPALQNIIRQNVRLDLAFARNALQMQDKAAFTQIASTLKNEIERYFDTQNADVASALNTLEQLNGAQISLPDLAPMIQTLRSAP